MTECFEVTNKVSDLIKQAEECIEYLNEDSVGYYYMWMLQTLKQLNKNGNLIVMPKCRVKKTKDKQNAD